MHSRSTTTYRHAVWLTTLSSLGIAALSLAGAASAAADECPDPLRSALRLVLVTPADMQGRQTLIRTYERPSQQATWVASGVPLRGVVGRKGLAWGFGFQHLRQGDEPLKKEGDLRSPAGVFPLGPTFGFKEASFPGHMVLKPGQHYCVDAPSSPQYNRIVTKKSVPPQTSGEDMGRIGQYRKGLIVGYQSPRELRTGSCIFVHIWRNAQTGTAGCVAASEASILRLMRFARRESVIAIVPAGAVSRFGTCLPRALGSSL